MSYKTITDLRELQTAITENPAVLVYFSAAHCNVCISLKPKLAGMLEEYYPLMKMYYVDVVKTPLISGQMTVFSIPSIIVFLDGKEYLRQTRSFGVEELRGILKKPYEIINDK